MLETLEGWDQQLFLFLNSLRADWLDLPMYIMTKAWCWLPLFVFMLWKLWKKHPKKPFVFVLLGIALTVAIGDLVSTRVFKYQIQRYRPTHHLVIGEQVNTVNDFNGNEYRGGKYGFLSSHATNYFGIATIVFLLLGATRNWRWLFIWAALVAYTRLYLGVHYPSDLFAGALLGMSLGYLFFHLTTFLIDKYSCQQL